jgi:hypothetical protein
MEVLNEQCLRYLSERLHDNLLAAGCLLTPTALEVIAAAKRYADSDLGVHPWAVAIRDAVRAHRDATEPLKYVADHLAGNQSVARLNGEAKAIFFGAAKVADCEAWVAMKNGGRT